MAIIQISKIQQRSGNLVDLPQLDEAQFGWADDAKRLFIGKTSGTPENIEVLTSYSNISFSQIQGASGSNISVTDVQSGQILSYNSTTSAWVNSGGNGLQPSNTSLYTSGNIHLGDVSTLKVGGGATGYVLETDGTGNLSWTSKGTISTNILAMSNDNPIVMTVPNVTPYTNNTVVTISGVQGGNANSIVNGQSFYVQLEVDFPTSGNVTLYTSSGGVGPVDGTGLDATANTGRAVTSLGGSGNSAAQGSNTTIQYNNGGVLSGDANFTFTGTVVTLVGNMVVGNLTDANLVSANYFTGTLTTAAQPNITSTGTLASLSVTGNANVGNLNTAGNVIASQVTANSNGTGNNFKVGDDAFIGDINVVNTMVVKGQQDGTQGYIVFGNTNTTNYIGRNGSNAITVTGAFSVTANANIGNVGTAGLITATGNVTAGNLITAGVLSAGGNANVGNLGTAGIFATTLSSTGNANVGNLGTAGLITATGNITGGNIIGTHYGAATGLTSIPGANVTGAVAYATTANAVAGANVSGAVAFATTANSVAGANVSGQVGNALVAGTVYIAAQPNITSTGTLASLSVTANANIGNIGTAGLITATGNVTAGNLVTAGVVSASGNASVLGIKTDNYYYANGVSISFAGSYSNSNVAAYLPTYTGTVGATTLTTGANTTAGTITGNWSLSSGSKLLATYADLAEYYEADAHYEPGTVLAFGGEKEVTLAEDGTTRVAGVVSTNPAYAMNTKCPGIAVEIALQGRVPTKVRGTIRKGDMMVSAGNGYARPSNSPTMGTVIGKALENFDGIEGVIEVAVGRL